MEVTARAANVNILTATDSRGRLIKPHLEARLPKSYELHFISKSGYRILDLAKFIIFLLRRNQVDLILLAVGVCDLSDARPTPHTTHQSVNSMVHSLTEK